MGKLVALFGRPYRTALLALALLGLFAGLWVVGWSKVRQRVLASEAYWLKLENVEVTPLPEWIHTDVRAEVIRDASLDRPLSIMDSDLVERIANAFKMHPWVAEVRQVRKHHPARVTVELDYRCPVCMVQVPGGLLPVDAQGVLLPSTDFSPLEAGRYPRLVGIDSAPVGPPGERWGDARVAGAAEIAAAFGPAWERLGLERIVCTTAISAGRVQDETYELLTRGGTRVLWGRAPSAEIPSEVPAAEKVARLEKYAAQRGSLDGPNGPGDLDIRTLEPARSDPRTAIKHRRGRR